MVFQEISVLSKLWLTGSPCAIKAAFHDTDIDILARILVRILADTSDMRNFLARIFARTSVSVSVSM